MSIRTDHAQSGVSTAAAAAAPQKSCAEPSAPTAWPTCIERALPHLAPLRGFAFALVLTLCATGLSRTLPFSRSSPVFIFYTLAIGAAAWVGGLRGGIAALVFSTLEAWWLLFPASYRFGLDPNTTIRLLATLVVGSLAVAVIAARRRAEEELRASETRFRKLFASLPLSALLIDPGDHHFVLFNDAAARNLGYTRKEFATLSVPDIEASQDEATIAQYHAQMLRRAQAFETRHRTKSGELRDVSVSGQAVEIGGRPLVLGIWTDITERKRAERQLYFFKALMDQSADPLFVISPEEGFRYVYVNAAACRHYGRTEQELLRMRVPDWDPSFDSREKLDLVQQQLRSKGSYFVETTHRNAEGPDIPVEVSVSYISYEGREFSVGYVRNIAERKRAEDALRQSEAQFRQLADSMPQLIWITSPDGDTQYVNQRWYDFTATPLEQIRGEMWSALLHPDDYERTLNRWAQSLRTGEPYEIEYRLRGENGCYRWFLARALPVRDDHGGIKRWFGTCTDIEDQKQAERALIRSEKLASVGRMAATVAHEINNPLAAAINSLYLAYCEPSLPGPARNYLATAQRELERVAHITKQTLGFYRESGTPGVVCLPEIVDGVLDLYAPKLKSKHVRVIRKYHGTSPVCAFEGELRQVVSNLVGNAIDAVASYGSLHVRTGPASWTSPRSTVRLTVADNGCGISTENIKRVFEPFFTTKPSFGTGLGLWVSSELVRKHEGHIRVRSRKGAGTVFCVWLPQERRKEGREPTA